MKIALLGTGNMGRAIIAGCIKQSSEKISIIAWDTIAVAREHLPEEVCIAPPESWFVKHAVEVVIVAVKPQDMMHSCTELAEFALKAHASPLWISIAAGVSLSKLSAWVGANARICRVMPNTPALIGEGVSAYSLSPGATQADSDTVGAVLNSIGSSLAVPEKMINAVTGLSGSGPAYVYLFIEALIEGGVTAGLPRDVAEKLALQTVIGSAKMVAQTGDSPSQLKAKVMSPGGTTAQGLLALEEEGFKYAIIKAIAAATRRADELGA